jgi:hypothetical protein
MAECKHEKRKNFAVCRDSIQHEYCPVCGWHLFRGVEYTKEQWKEKYIDERITQ